MMGTSAAGQIRGAIYAGLSFGPTTLIVESAPQSIVPNAWNEIPIASHPLQVSTASIG